MEYKRRITQTQLKKKSCSVRMSITSRMLHPPWTIKDEIRCSGNILCEHFACAPSYQIEQISKFILDL